MGASEHNKSFPIYLIPCYRAGLGAHSKFSLTFRCNSLVWELYQMDSSPAPNQKNKLGAPLSCGVSNLWVMDPAPHLSELFGHRYCACCSGLGLEEHGAAPVPTKIHRNLCISS